MVASNPLAPVKSLVMKYYTSLKTVALICAAVALWVSGCRKTEPPATPPPGSPAAKALNEMDQKLASGDVRAQLQVLSQLLQAWVMTRNGFPSEVQEFVQAKMIAKVPAPPAGKRFAIDRQSVQVVLADQ